MRPMRGGSGFSIPSVRTMAAKLAIALIAASFLGAILEKTTGVRLALVPQDVYGLALWQPITFIPIAARACGIVKRPACQGGKPSPNW